MNTLKDYRHLKDLNKEFRRNSLAIKDLKKLKNSLISNGLTDIYKINKDISHFISKRNRIRRNIRIKSINLIEGSPNE